MTEQFIQILGRRRDGSIQFMERDDIGLGHAFARTECVDLAEGVRRMGYMEEAEEVAQPLPKKLWILVFICALMLLSGFVAGWWAPGWGLR
jgi:hypothetical protein